MSFEDRSLLCADCGATFTFTAGEQEFFATKGYSNDPKRCLTCREARKVDRGGLGGGYSSRRRMYPATCAECGIETEVPFEPREGRPVYCSNCYNATRTGSYR